MDERPPVGDDGHPSPAENAHADPSPSAFRDGPVPGAATEVAGDECVARYEHRRVDRTGRRAWNALDGLRLTGVTFETEPRTITGDAL